MRKEKRKRWEENSMDLVMPCEIIWNECNGRRSKCIWLGLDGWLAGWLVGSSCARFVIWMIINVTAVQIHSNAKHIYATNTHAFGKENVAHGIHYYHCHWIEYPYTTHVDWIGARSSWFNRKQPSYDLFVLP